MFPLETTLSNFVFQKTFSLYTITCGYVSPLFNIKEREITGQISKVLSKTLKNAKLISGQVKMSRKHLACLDASSPKYNLI